MKRKIAGLFVLSVLGFLVYAYIKGHDQYNTQVQTLKDFGTVVDAKVVKVIQVRTGIHKRPLHPWYQIEYTDPATKKVKVGYVAACRNYLGSSSKNIAINCIFSVPSPNRPQQLPMLYVPTSQGVYDGCKVSSINTNYWDCSGSLDSENSLVSFDVSKF